MTFPFRNLILAVAALLSQAVWPLQAQQMGAISQDYTSLLSGSNNSLVVGGSAALTYAPAGEQSVLIKNIITLGLNEQSSAFLPASFTATVTVTITYGASATTTASFSQTLTVTYNPAGGMSYNPANYVNFTGAQYVKVTVTAISAPTLSNGVNTATLLSLKDEMLVWRTYALSTTVALTPTLTFTAPPASPTPDELPVSWTVPTGGGNNGVQLEWSWVENEMRSYYSSYDLLFRNNCSRLDLPLSATGYNIPLYYDGAGQLFCRLRAINILSTGTLTYGPWSAIDSFPFTGHNNNLNWQVSTAYAEDGKRKAVMQYYDGSLRQRQSVTKDNTTNTTLSAETFYDGQGRPAVQVLPAPGINSIVAYTQNLNLFNGQTPGTDPAVSFDLQPASGGSAAIPSLQTISGAALYYSADNPEIAQNANQNIPDAAGYPYTATRYTPDATGRVMTQSSVGQALTMGSGHETQYYYGNAAQEELDGLFGTEVGDFSHYFKNMVQDANGQMSVSYVDMHGRTIATALAGAAPPGITALNLTGGQYPGQAGTSITRNLLNGNSNAVRDNSIVSVNSLLVPVTTAFNFSYSLAAMQYSLSQCSKAPICYDCMYDLQIAITDESGNQAPIILNYTSVQLQQGNVCGGPLTAFQAAPGTTIIPSGNAISFSETLLPGSYSIRKTLTVDPASAQAFQSQNQAAGTCDSLTQLIDSVYAALLPTSNCNTTATSTPCQSCLTSLGSYAAFKTSYLATLSSTNQPTDSAIHAVYSADSANCANLCGGNSHQLATLQQLMLSDMMPYSGQYAQNPANVPMPGTMFNKYNIFSTADGGGQPFYQHPWTSSQTAGYYYDAAGNVDQTIDPNGVLLAGLTPATFTGLFAPSWATSLLPHHPEYAQLVFAQTHLASSYDWINNFDSTSTFSGAVTLGYTTSTGNTENDDPFFTVSPSSKTTVTKYETTASYYNNQSLWQMAYTSAICASNSTVASQTSCASAAALQPPYSSLTTAQMNQVWQAYQGLYTALRDSLLTAYIKANSPNTDDDNLVAQGFILRFPVTATEVASQYGWSGFAPQPVGSAPPVNMTDSIASTDTSRCGSYIATWINALSNCPTLESNPNLTAILQAITSGMEAVCEKGQDQSNPFGSSDVAPTWPNDGTPRTFEAVINSVLHSYGIDTTNQYCNPFVISWPKPYGANPALTTEVMSGIDTCSCKQFARISAAATAAGYNPAVLSSLNVYLNNTYHDSLTQVVFTGLQQCASLPLIYCHYDTVSYQYILPAQPCTGNILTGSCGTKQHPSDTCTETCQYQFCDTAYFLALTSIQHRPLFLDCNYSGGAGCLTCARLSALITSYKAYFASQPCGSAPILTDSNLTPAQIGYNITFAQYVNYQTGLQLNWTDYVNDAAAASCILANYTINGGATQTVVCASTLPLTDTTGILEVDSPCAKVYNMAVAIAQSIYQQRQSQVQANFLSGYNSQCLNVQSTEQFKVTYTNSEYHYTLYYYDEAGNLVKTVPPAGARPNFSSAFISAVEAAKLAGTVDTPAHLLQTNYRYNSLNAVIAQKTPDAGISNSWYDVLGRLVVSQNAQQFHDGNYSYTLYDPFGRITEVGQKPQSTAMTQAISQNATSLLSWINTTGGTKAWITETVYDQPGCTCIQPMMTQANLRNRVSYTYTKNLYTDPSWYTATYYTYDVHGNVDTLLQDYLTVPAMSSSPYKQVCYNYDLVSGKVNGVDYQPGKPDAFYYRYQYDAENRLVNTLTSRDSITWEQDVDYSYYKHGQLARTVVGQLQTQGVDYSYTLQGWLKGTNIGNGYGATIVDSSGTYCPPGSALANLVVDSRSDSAAPAVYTAITSITFEPGFETYPGDAMSAVINPSATLCTPPTSGSSTAGSASGLSEVYPVGLDAYSFSLHYYSGDYKPIGATTPVVNVLQAIGAQAAPLYNGNIAAMAVVIDPGVDSPLVYNYHYDQLNRLAQMDAFKGLNYSNHTFTPIQLPDYQERPAYDPNGNIMTYVRHGYGANIPMDSLTYNYYPGCNQLQRINDGAGGVYTTDLKDQGTGSNYTYDLIGNLKQDVTNGVSYIGWTVYGKIDTITNGSGTITYTYDAAGNRITKTASGTTSVYVRDAQGNILAIYTQTGSGSPVQTEIDLYGSSRLGSVRALTVAPTTVALGGGYGNATTSTFTRGEKSYELTNHLGNVLSTITDKKIAVVSGSNSSLIDHFTADIATAQDYYPFGMLMPGRTTAANYRYGFNGKENDNEVKGVGDQIEYGARVYDPRVGRFMSIDPLQKKFPELSPYQFASNGPISNMDLDGRESYWYKFDIDKKTGNVVATLVAVKKSWLDWITISHLVVKIGNLDWEYDADFIKSNGELDQEVEKIKKDPIAYYADMMQRKAEMNKYIADWKQNQKKDEEFMWMMAFGTQYKGSTAGTTVAAEDEAVASNNSNHNEENVKTAGEEEGTNNTTKSAVSRLPVANGKWSGEPGNSEWNSTIPEIEELTAGEGIPFVNGTVDFSKWSVAEFKIEGLTGNNSTDFSLVYKKLMSEYGFKTQKAAADWLKTANLTIHHATATTVQLVPSALNNQIPHVGAASDLRSN